MTNRSTLIYLPWDLECKKGKLIINNSLLIPLSLSVPDITTKCHIEWSFRTYFSVIAFLQVPPILYIFIYLTSTE